MLENLTVVTHPLVQHKLTLMREKDTSTASFRQLLREISLLLAYEVTRELPMTTKKIETPLELMDAPAIDGKAMLRRCRDRLGEFLRCVPCALVLTIVPLTRTVGGRVVMSTSQRRRPMHSPTRSEVPIMMSMPSISAR